MKGDRFFYVMVAVVALIGIGLFAIPVRAHDWYPMECCHAMDCAPVESSAFTQPMNVGGLPQMVVTTKHGTVVVPQNFPRRQSKDHLMHVCMRPGENGTMRLICLFDPPGI
jgi:hypothetical protein